MNDRGEVNGQIVDSVADVVTLTAGHAPAQALGMLDTVMTETLGMAMYNAVSRQQGAGMIGSAATTATCARIVTAPSPAPAPPTPAPAPAPAPDPDPVMTIISTATATAYAAIQVLRERAVGESFDASIARSNLQALAALAGGPAPAPAPAPVPAPEPAPEPTPAPAPAPAPVPKNKENP